jgi:hypothetical protein
MHHLTVLEQHQLNGTGADVDARHQRMVCRPGFFAHYP